MNTTIKTTYMILGTALIITSCGQEDLPYNGKPSGSDRRIVFTSSLPGVTTRGEAITESSLPYFQVIAFDPVEKELIGQDGSLKEYAKDVTLNKDPENGKYFSDDCVWPDPGKETDMLHFFAYYPSVKAMQDSIDNTKFKLVNKSTVTAGSPALSYSLESFRVASDISKQVDFITGYSKGSMDNNLFSGISLTLNHNLSRIEVKAKSMNKSCKLEIAGVRIGKIHTEATYDFNAGEGTGYWTIDNRLEKGNVEYIYRQGDKIVAIDKEEAGVSIMGGPAGSVRYAMLLPDTYEDKWDFDKDNTNLGNNLYISVLLRVLDKTPNGNDKQQYPYFDNSQGLNAMNIPRVYLAVDNSGIVRANPGQLYKGDDGKYYTDEAKKTPYIAPQGCAVKEFGWAALPVTGKWEAGHYYTYTLDYTSGVGLHDPSVGGIVSPKAGDPIISDRVGVSVSVNDWQGLNGSTTHTVDVPGS